MALTDEQIKEALKSEAIKDAIKDAVEGEVKGLKKKNDELLGKVQAAKALEDRLEALEKEKEELETKNATKTGDVDKIKQTYEDKIKKMEEKLNGENSKLKSQLQTEVVDKSLTAALLKAKVKPDMVEIVADHIRSKFKGEIADNDGKPFAKFDGKAVDEFVTGWAQTDAGKHFIAADNNSGGGSNGTNGNGKAGNGNDGKKTMARSEFDGLSMDDKIKNSKEGVVLTD